MNVRGERQSEEERAGVLAAVEHAAHLLPAQGPISIFVHHNTLHAFEGVPFEEAVVRGGQALGCEPFLSEERFHAELSRGRILGADLQAVIAEDLGATATAPVAGLTTRQALRQAMVQLVFIEPGEPELRWLLAETRVLEHLRRDLPPELRRGFLDRARSALGRDRSQAALETGIVQRLWTACLGVARKAPAEHVGASYPLRLGDLLRLAADAGPQADADRLVQPLLIRLAGAFLDQGIAYWGLAAREEGFFAAFSAVYGESRGGERWRDALAAVIAEESRRGGDAVDSVLRSLAAMGVTPDAYEPVIAAELLAIRGWAGMFRQIEARPDRVPVQAPPARLMDFLAALLCAERAALAVLAREHLGFAGDLSALRGWLIPQIRPQPPASEEARAAGLFQVAQALGIDGAALERLDRESAAALLGEISSFSGVERRRIFHLAYERRQRVEALDALAQHARRPAPGLGGESSSFQAVFCIDDREESLRRHLEEISPECETIGFAGFFGVAMYYRGAEDAYPTPLCPIAIRPTHEVEEEVDADFARRAVTRARGRRLVGRLRRGFEVGTRTFARGSLLTAAFGLLAVVPLVSRVLFPRLTASLRLRGERWVQAPSRTHLALSRRPEVTPQLGAHAGYSHAEMAGIVREMLTLCGLAGRLSPLVLIVGHGSSSLNNPHGSAYECGACGGGKGGPNARAFAQMANEPAVRALLAAEGVEIPSGTWFVGALHNTCDDAVKYFDVELVPDSHKELFARARRAIELARAYNAHERCRRFESAPLWLPPMLALAHVEARSQDLAQVRAELGHATNALAVVGRRARTRGLFCDRRAFLISYDPTRDQDGEVLSRLLAAVVPVCAGINLEYYFSHVDPAGYGSGSKLPHNLVSLLGVMNGGSSDLRTGLPWQMVELHEPVRLLMVVEARVEVAERVLAADPSLRRLVDHRWIQLAILDPDGAGLSLRVDGSFQEYVPENMVLATSPSSSAWYRGRRDHLPFAQITGGA